MLTWSQKKYTQKGKVDVINLIVIFLLVTTIFVGTIVTSDRSIILNLSNKAASLDLYKLEKQAKEKVAAEKEAAKDQAKKEQHAQKQAAEAAQENNGPKGSYGKLSDSQRASIDFDTYKTKLNNGEPVPTPTTETASAPNGSCDANGTAYKEGDVVVFSSGANDYRKCLNGRWETSTELGTKLEITDLTPAYVPTYLKSDYAAEIDKKNAASLPQLAPHVNPDIVNPDTKTSSICNVKIISEGCGAGGGSTDTYYQVYQTVDCKIVPKAVSTISCQTNEVSSAVGCEGGQIISYNPTTERYLCRTSNSLNACKEGNKICQGDVLRICSASGIYVNQTCQHGCSNNTCNATEIVQDKSIENTYNALNNLTFGNFGNYVQTYQQIAKDNKDATYLQQAFDPAGIKASTDFAQNIIPSLQAQTAILVTPVVGGADIVVENAKYDIAQLTSTKKTFYILELNKQVYEKNGVIYDASSDQSLGPTSLYQGNHFIDKPVTIYSAGGENQIYGSKNSEPITLNLLFQANQHTTITQEGLASPAFQSILTQAKEQANSPATLENIKTITSIVNSNLPYYQPLNWVSPQNSSATTLQEASGYLGYQNTYRTLDNQIQNNVTICFDQAQVEFDTLTAMGYKPVEINNSKLAHTYLTVNIQGQDYVVDPTNNEVTPLKQHQEENNYTSSDIQIIPSPFEEIEGITKLAPKPEPYVAR